jgi:hypothetical protein
MAANADPIPDERLSIEQRSDGSIVVRVRSEGPEDSRLPDAVFSFRSPGLERRPQHEPLLTVSTAAPASRRENSRSAK